MPSKQSTRSGLLCGIALVLVFAFVPAQAGAKGKKKKGGKKAKVVKGYKADQILETFVTLAKKTKLPIEKRKDLKFRLKKQLGKKSFKKKMARFPIRAVFAFRSGEGGFVVKFMSGSGHISFFDGRQKGKISLRSVSAGAQVGGSSSWGLGLVMGLKNEDDFGGDYKGGVRGATAGDATTYDYPMLHQSGDTPHQVLLITSARGLSAGIGGGKLTITPDWE